MAEAIDRFVYDGQIYYQQYRTCGNAGCKCHSGKVTDKHGAYWYRKFEGGVGTRYVGKELPEPVSKARDRYKQWARQIEGETTKYQVRLRRLERLRRGGTLTTEDVKILKRWGVK